VLGFVDHGASFALAAAELGMSQMTAWRRAWFARDYDPRAKWVPHQRSTRECPRGAPARDGAEDAARRGGYAKPWRPYGKASPLDAAARDAIRARAIAASDPAGVAPSMRAELRRASRDRAAARMARAQLRVHERDAAPAGFASGEYRAAFGVAVCGEHGPYAPVGDVGCLRCATAR